MRQSRDDSIEDAVSRAQDAGGWLLERGEHAPGIPFASVADPDGYTVEISRSFGRR
jgi:catechol 2,3-dioxygenase-like lactoylglutathione lyase family enzyme